MNEAEVTLSRDNVLRFMAYGICPPPLVGYTDYRPGLYMSLALRDRWDLEGPPLHVADERGVELQARRWGAEMVAITNLFHGSDPIIICRCPR